MSIFRSGLYLGASLIAFSAIPANAQTAPTQTPPDETPAAEGDIVVTGQRASQQRAIDIKRNTIGVVDVAAADEIGRLPDRNVAEVVEHLPGVGVTYDQGEGRFVSIRGVPSALNNYTLSGIEVGNPEGTTRSLPLDVISGQLLNRVEVNKVKTADMDGQGIGGSINLVPQTAFDYKNAFTVAGSAKAGYQELNGKVPVQGDLSVAGRFGRDQQFGLVLGASYSHRDFESDGFYPDDWRPITGVARGGLPTDTKYTAYSLDRKRLGASGSFDWHPNDQQTFFVRGIYSKFIEDEIRVRYRLDFATDALLGISATNPNGIAPTAAFKLNPDGTTGTVIGTPSSATGAPGTGPERREDLRLDYKTKSLFTGSAGGSTEIGALKVDYVGARSRNEVLDQFPIWQFRCNPGTVSFDLTQKLFVAAPNTECSPAQVQFRQYTYSHQKGVEDIWQGKFDATYDLGGESFLKAGAKFRATDRKFDANNDVYDRGTTTATRFTLGQFGLQDIDAIVRPDQSDTARGYRNSPTIDPVKMQAFTDSNLPGPYFLFNPGTSLTNATLSDFSLSENVIAGYALGNFQRGAVTVTPGIRYEHTQLHITGFQLRGATVIPATRDNSYDDFLPSLIVRIRPSDDTVFRLAYSRSIGRPEYANLSPGGSIDPVNLSASFGNPDLKPYRADNLDATAEWYFARGGLLSIGVFGKFIKNPIFSQSTLLTNVTLAGVLYPTISISQPFNADKGDIIGIEAQYQQQFTFLPGLLSGFGLQLNGTLTDSNLRLPTGRTSTFPSQSKYLYGGELFYQKGPLEASVAYHNTGHALLAVGGLPYQDQSNDDLRRLDAKASIALLYGVSVFFEAQNLTDEATRQYQGDRPDWTIQNERYGRTFYGGISAKF